MFWQRLFQATRGEDLSYDPSVTDEEAKWAQLALVGIIVRPGVVSDDLLFLGADQLFLGSEPLEL